MMPALFSMENRLQNMPTNLIRYQSFPLAHNGSIAISTSRAWLMWHHKPPSAAVTPYFRSVLTDLDSVFSSPMYFVISAADHRRYGVGLPSHYNFRRLHHPIFENGIHLYFFNRVGIVRIVCGISADMIVEHQITSTTQYHKWPARSTPPLSPSIHL